MSKALKWDMLTLSILIFHWDIHKIAWKDLKILFHEFSSFVNGAFIAFLRPFFAFCVITFEPIKIQTHKHLKMTVWISILWKISMLVAKKWLKMVFKRLFISCKFWWSISNWWIIKNIFKCLYEYLNEKLKYRNLTHLILKLLAW